MQECAWIRYTYDFGDCWEHKIVLEKELEDFHERHAVLLKLKGEHFMEDCGGSFFAGAYDRISTDEMTINAQLEQSEFPVFERKPVKKSLFRELEDDDSFEGRIYRAFIESFAKHLESERMLMNNPALVEDMLMYEQLSGRTESAFYPWDEDALEMFKPEIPTFVREQPKIGRNDPCPCGSGKKYKK